MNLIKKYELSIQNGEIKDDPMQRKVLAHMQELANKIKKRNSSFIYLLVKSKIKGLYLYGPVGVGKTFLIDLFFENLDEKKKARVHFHYFMQQIDLQLRELQGKKNPLKIISKRLAKSINVLCFDEFMVHDVAHAMILADLLKAFITQGIILVISSNIPPDDLYRGGVHRRYFLPAIAAIKAHCVIHHLVEKKDYRLGRVLSINAYLYPLNRKTASAMEQQFLHFSQQYVEEGMITIQNREIPYIKCGEKAIWFSFNMLCNLPRSQLDYLEIADKFDTVFLSDIPVLTINHTLQTIMFIHFIDVMYDRGIYVVFSAEVPIEQLYIEGEMKETFKRTLSRLFEMQSLDYLARHPKRVIHELISHS